MKASSTEPGRKSKSTYSSHLETLVFLVLFFKFVLNLAIEDLLGCNYAKYFCFQIGRDNNYVNPI